MSRRPLGQRDFLFMEEGALTSSHRIPAFDPANPGAPPILVDPAGLGGGGGPGLPEVVNTHPGYYPGSWYSDRPTYQSFGLVPPPDFFPAVPFRLERNLGITALAIRVLTGSAGSFVRLAVYAHNDHLKRPTDLLIGTDPIPLATNNAAAIGMLGGAVALEPGCYWLAAHFSGGATVGASEDVSFMPTVGSNTAEEVLELDGPAQGINGLADYVDGLPVTFGDWGYNYSRAPVFAFRA